MRSQRCRVSNHIAPQIRHPSHRKLLSSHLNEPQDAVEEMRKAFEERRDVICQRFDEINGVGYVKPQGAFYIFPDFSDHYGRTLGGQKIENSIAITDYLLNSAGVGVVPGDGFGADNHLRLSFATSLTEINRGLDRIKKALA